jgi:hypothetical protein
MKMIIWYAPDVAKPKISTFEARRTPQPAAQVKLGG